MIVLSEVEDNTMHVVAELDDESFNKGSFLQNVGISTLE